LYCFLTLTAEIVNVCVCDCVTDCVDFYYILYTYSFGFHGKQSVELIVL